MVTIEQQPRQLYDMDHVLVGDGRVYRVLGNFAVQGPDSGPGFLGYNLYSPCPNGDRNFRGERYTKNYTEDTTLPRDVLDTYEVVDLASVTEYFDPIDVAQRTGPTYEGTVWSSLYFKLVEIFGEDSIGVFGSALPGSGLHLTDQGTIENDVDFFIEGLDNVPRLKEYLHELREGLGFTDYSEESQQKIMQSWRHVFRNPNNSFEDIMARRWSGMQIRSAGKVVLNTFRFRDRDVATPSGLLDASNIVDKNVSISGTAVDAHHGNLYPRRFTVEQSDSRLPVYSFWWKFSSPVTEGDRVNVCGDVMDIDGQQVLRLTNYEDHWIHHTEGKAA